MFRSPSTPISSVDRGDTTSSSFDRYILIFVVGFVPICGGDAARRQESLNPVYSVPHTNPENDGMTANGSIGGMTIDDVRACD